MAQTFKHGHWHYFIGLLINYFCQITKQTNIFAFTFHNSQPNIEATLFFAQTHKYQINFSEIQLNNSFEAKDDGTLLPFSGTSRLPAWARGGWPGEVQLYQTIWLAERRGDWRRGAERRRWLVCGMEWW